MKKTIAGLAVVATLTALVFINVPFLFASETDDRIESSARASYVFKTYLKDDDVNVRSKDGIVTLTGTVAEESDKALARETVATLPGVQRVDNKLKLQGKVNPMYSYAWLIAKVKSTLLFHRNVSATRTEVLAEKGVVTLRGEAENEAQKDLSTEFAKDVEGVKAVNNEMTVSTATMASGGKTMGEKMDNIGESIDDASVTALVKTTLLYHRSTSALKTTVETKEGVVNLGGNAKNAAEKDLATKLVSDVHGVKQVVNNMIVG